MDVNDFQIYPIPDDQARMYCGPTVLALLTGKTREAIHRDVNKLKRKAGFKSRKTITSRSGHYMTTKRIPWKLTNAVKGLHNSDLQLLLIKYGLKPKRVNTAYPSLNRLVEDIGHFKMPIIVNVTGHYVLYFRGVVYDTAAKTGKPVKDHPSFRQRVKRYWIIEKPFKK